MYTDPTVTRSYSSSLNIIFFLATVENTEIRKKMCNNGIVFPVIYHHQDIRLSPIKILQFLGRRKRLEGPLPHHHTANAHTHTHCVCVDIVSYTLYSYKQPRFYIQARLFCLSSSRQSNGREREMNERTDDDDDEQFSLFFFCSQSVPGKVVKSACRVCVCADFIAVNA